MFILGPCVIESEKFVWRMARKIVAIAHEESVDLIFKASYDKANRTSVRSFRGIGVNEGCEILSTIGLELKIPVTTDVHSPAEAEIAAGAYRGPLHGVTVAHKDIIDVAGLPTTAASRILAENIAAKDATVSAKLRAMLESHLHV